jgi:hypothetical protein
LPQDRLRRLAERIDALAAKDAQLMRQARDMRELRAKAALGLHAVCARFVRETSQHLKKTELKLDPPDFRLENFKEDSANLIQINAQGRLIQVEFEATVELVSTEDFRIPYTLEGAVRCFNQELLSQDVVKQHLLFYCLEKSGNLWRFFDERTYRSGPFNVDYLAGLMEAIV